MDHLLGGGLPIIPDIVVSGTEKDVFLFSQCLMWNRVKSGDLCVYSTVSRTQKEVQDNSLSLGRDLSPFIRQGILRIVDYSFFGRKSKTSDENYRTVKHVNEVLDPDSVHRVLAKEFLTLRVRRPNRRFLFIIDSMDKLITLMGLENILHFKKKVSNLFDNTNSCGLTLLYSDLLSNEILESVRREASVFIELTRKQDGRQMSRVTKNLYSGWSFLY